MTLAPLDKISAITALNAGLGSDNEARKLRLIVGSAKSGVTDTLAATGDSS